LPNGLDAHMYISPISLRPRINLLPILYYYSVLPISLLSGSYIHDPTARDAPLFPPHAPTAIMPAGPVRNNSNDKYKHPASFSLCAGSLQAILPLPGGFDLPAPTAAAVAADTDISNPAAAWDDSRIMNIQPHRSPVRASHPGSSSCLLAFFCFSAFPNRPQKRAAFPFPSCSASRGLPLREGHAAAACLLACVLARFFANKLSKHRTSYISGSRVVAADVALPNVSAVRRSVAKLRFPWSFHACRRLRVLTEYLVRITHDKHPYPCRLSDASAF
jgi:hypothetical protein